MDKTNKAKQKKKNFVFLVLGLLLIGTVVGGIIWAVQPGSVLNPTPTTPTDKSTFVYKDYITSEDVSWVPFTIWTPKSTSTFDDLDDVFNVAKYQSSASSRASAIEIDLSDYDYVLVQPDPDDDAPYAENWQLITPNGQNAEYTIYALDPTTDVNFNVMDENLNEVTVASHQTDGNYTIVYDCDHYMTTAAQMHYGTNWEVSATDFADLSATQKEWYYDEANFAGQFPLFNPQDDTYTYKTSLSHPALADFTDCFAFKFTFNDSISIVDGEVNQVNFTISDNAPWEVAVSAEVIYVVSYEPILFTGGMLDLGFEISYAANISLSDVDSGNVPILQSGNSFGTFVKLSDIAA